MSKPQNPKRVSTSTTLMNEKSLKINNAVAYFKDLQGTILKDTDELKSEIQSSVEGLIALLKTREQQLLRQVDVLARNESVTIQTQIARLHYAQGLFDMYTRWLEDGKSGSALPHCFNKTLVTADEIIKNTDKMSKLYSDISEVMKFTADPESLTEPILNFGCVKAASSVVCFTEVEESKCLPSRVEEYEDVDHHMSYKSLEELTMKEPFTVKLNSLKEFQNECEWLRESDLSSPRSDGLKTVSKLEKELKMEMDSPLNSNSMQTWLQDVIKEPMETESDTECSKSSSDESIVMISLPGTDFPMEQWKENCLPKFSKLHSEVMKDFQNLCCNHDMEDDPQSCTTRNKNTWLRKDCQSENKSKSKIPEVNEVCCANEPCNTLYDCLCERNCALIHKQQSLKGDDKTFRLVDPMLNILYGKNNWLWEERHDGQERNFNFLSEFQLGGDLKNWLNSETFVSSIQSKLATFGLGEEFGKTLGNESDLKSEWLRKKELNEKIKRDHCQIANMFQSYFGPIDMNVWLANEN